MPNQVRQARGVTVENVVIVDSVNPAENPDGITPVDAVEVAMIDSDRAIRLRAGAAHTHGPILAVGRGGPVRESDSS